MKQFNKITKEIKDVDAIELSASSIRFKNGKTVRKDSNHYFYAETMDEIKKKIVAEIDNEIDKSQRLANHYLSKAMNLDKIKNDIMKYTGCEFSWINK